MADIFFSYSSKDRDRVQPIRDALVNRGFSIFWDQEVPAATDWDTWIRRHLNDSKCAIVIWSVNSIGSDNVRHEAVVARQQNKMVPVLLDAINADQFPMGLLAMQATNLTSWSGDLEHDEWKKLVTQIESQLMPLWVRRSIDTIEAELVAERSRREAAERRDRTLRDQIRKEAEAQQQLHAELDDARHQLEQLTARYQATDSEGARAAARKTTELSEKLEVSEAKRKELEQTSEELGRRLRVLENELRDARAAQSAAPRPGVGVGAEQSSPIPSYAQPVITRTSSQTATALKAAALASAFSGVVFLALAVSNLSSSYYYDFESGYGWTMKLGWVLSCIPMAVAIAKRQMALGRMWVGPCLAVPVTWIAAGSFFAGLPESFPDILAWPRTFGIAAFIGGGAAAGIAQRDVFSSSGIGKCALVGGFYIAGHLAWIVIPRVLWGITFTDLVYDHPWGTMTAFGATFAFAGHVALAFVILSEVPQQASSQSTVSLFS